MSSNMYSEYALQYDHVIQDNVYNAHLERPSLQSLLSPVSGLDILDLGCGSGVYAQYFIQQKVKSITCIDFSREMIALVKEKFGRKVTAYVQDLSIGLPKEKNESADVVACPLVVHYLEDLNPLFKDIARVLKPQGYMVFSTHHPFVDFASTVSGNYFQCEYLTQQWNTIGKPVSVSFYRRSLTDITDAITKNGLVISKISEGKVAKEAEAISKKKYQYLRNNPHFIFIKCQKA